MSQSLESEESQLLTRQLTPRISVTNTKHLQTEHEHTAAIHQATRTPGSESSKNKYVGVDLSEYNLPLLPEDAWYRQPSDREISYLGILKSKMVIFTLIICVITISVIIGFSLGIPAMLHGTS